MIRVTKIGDLAFEIRLHDNVRQDLEDVSGWGTPEQAIERILSDVLFGHAFPAHYFDDLSGDIPF
ncbi:MAG TPA: hypothetical protein VF463_19720 [Sphingobium sp.]